MCVDSRNDLLPIFGMQFVAATFEPNELRSLDGSCQQFAVLNRVNRIGRSVYDKEGRDQLTQFSPQGLATLEHDLGPVESLIVRMRPAKCDPRREVADERQAPDVERAEGPA